MAELEAPTALADPSATVQAAVEEEPAVESWIALTQNGLGTLVEKPRLMADRLRKPPFRFLFDVIVEVARQTGFGLSELFRGTLEEKPQAPSSRDEKIAFLEQWVHLVQWALGPPVSGDLMAVCPANIVCGVKPEWTNFLLQCTAAAAWPSHCSVMRPPSPAPPVQQTVQQAPVVAPQQVQAPPMALPEEVPIAVEPPIDTTGHEAVAPIVIEQAPLVIEPEITVEQAREIAAGMDFSTTLSQFQSMHQEFSATKTEFPMVVPPSVAETAEDDGLPPGWEEIWCEEQACYYYANSETGESTWEKPAWTAPAPKKAKTEQAPEMADVDQSDTVEGEQVSESVGRVPLKQAAARTALINEEVRRAEELLNQIEEGCDLREETVKNKRTQLEEKLRAQQEEAANLEREAREAEEAAEQEAQRLKDEKAARKAARKAEKERVAAEEALEALKPVYPVSKYSAEHGARIVSCVGDDDEYAWDGDEEEQQPEKEVEKVQETSEVPLLSAAAFDLSAALADNPKDAVDQFGGQFVPGVGGSLFDKLKAQLKDTYVSYLCASMPATLLKQYKPGELVACLQFLLAELRKGLAQHTLEDVDDEEPTTIAEEIRGKFPSDWLTYLQEGTPSVFCQQYDIPELIDTLQSLSQICLDRLEDELGPLQSWVEESSPLKYIPSEEPMVVEVETPKGEREDGFAMANGSGGFGFTSELPPAPWEEPTPAVSRTHLNPTHGGLAATVSDFRHRGPSPTRAVTSHAPTVFDSTLGPAIWEQQQPTTVSYPATSHGTQAPRYATTALGGRGVHTAMPHPSGGPPHPTTTNGVPDYRRPMTHLGGHIIASR